METRFAGLSIEGGCGLLQRTRYARTFADREEFSDAHIAGENDLKSFCACGRELCETF